MTPISLTFRSKHLLLIAFLASASVKNAFHISQKENLFLNRYFFNQKPPQISILKSLVDTSTTWDRESWEAGFTNVEKECCSELSNRNIPLDLKGTYFRNVYGKFNVGDTKILHPFDADGMVVAITIYDGSVTFRNRVVRTKAFLQEQKTGKITERGTFSNHRIDGIFGNFFSTKFKNPANTNIVFWGGDVLALWEGGLPYQIEADSLKTIGEYTFGGLLQDGDKFTAHPRFDPRTENLIGFVNKPGVLKSTIKVLEFNKKFQKIAERSFDVPGLPFFHDFVVTENYYIFDAGPLSMDPLPLILGQQSPAQCIKFDSKSPSTILIIPRDANLPIQRVIVDTHFTFHFANGFEEKNGNIVVDAIWADKLVLDSENEGAGTFPVWETVDYEKEVPFATLQRYTFVPSDNKDSLGQPTSWSYTRNKLSHKNVEFPSINPQVSTQRHRYVYLGYGSNTEVASPLQGILKIDIAENKETMWLAKKEEYIGEVVFAPKKKEGCEIAEDEGYLLTHLSNWKKKYSEFLIFDAKDISKGPVYRAELPVVIPNGLHGNFVDGLVFEHSHILTKYNNLNS